MERCDRARDDGPDLDRGEVGGGVERGESLSGRGDDLGGGGVDGDEADGDDFADGKESGEVRGESLTARRELSVDCYT